MWPMTGREQSITSGAKFAISISTVLLSMVGCREEHPRAEPRLLVRENASVLTVRAGAQQWKWEGSTYVKLEEGPNTYYAAISEDARSNTVVRLIVRLRNDDDSWMLPIRVEDLNYIRSLETVRRVPGGKLFVDCGVNPSLGVAIVVDLARRTFSTYLGVGFVWNDDGSHIAYFQDPPHFGAPEGMPTRLFVDRTELGKFPRQHGYELAWKGLNILGVFREAGSSMEEVAEMDIRKKWH